MTVAIENSDRFFILTGPPGSGKTTLIDALAPSLTTVPEPARRVLAEQRRTGGRATGDQDPALFVDAMKTLAIADFERASGLTVFDRGLPDLLGFTRYYGLPEADIRHAINAYRYETTVFFLSGWREIYRTDAERTLDFKGAEAFGELIRAAYLGSGYNLVDVPRTAPEMRAQFILEQIGA